MKKISVSFLLFISFSVFGQDYLFFNPSSKKLFATASYTKTFSLSFDSVLTAGNDTTYYNFFTIPDTAANGPSNCPFWGPGCEYYQHHPTWIGKQIDHTATGLYRFYNLANDTLTFDMNINIGDTSLFYANSTGRFYIIYDLADTMSVFGNSDSVHFYRIWHTDNTGIPIVSPLHQQIIKIAKQWGLVSFFRVDSFPQVEQPLTLAGNISPDGGFNTMTSEMLYDYQPGDEVQYHAWQTCMQPCPPWLQDNYYTKYIFLSRITTVDSLIYSVQRTRFSVGDAQSVVDTIPIAYFQYDTLGRIPFELYDGKDRELTKENYCGEYYWTYKIYDPFQFIYCPEENCWGGFDVGCCPNAHRTWLQYVEKIGIYRNQYNSIQYFAGNTWGGNDIVYFKKNGIPCGQEVLVGINENTNGALNIQISPNPASEFIAVSSEYPVTRIIIYDLAGKEITVIQALRQNERIAVDNLENGIYFIRVFSYNKSASQKIVIIR